MEGSKSQGGSIPCTQFKLARRKRKEGEKGRQFRLPKPSLVFFRGQCCQQGPKSRTGRFSQLQAELEVISCDSG